MKKDDLIESLQLSLFDNFNGKLIAQTGYTVGGMRYKVNSIFDIESSPKSEEALKNLMAKEINNAS